MTKGLFKKNINRSIGGNLLVFLIVLLLACFMLLPIVYAVSSAFKPLDEIFIFPPRMFVRKPTLDNFVQLAQITSSSWVPLSRYIFNSLFVSAVGTVGHMLMASMAAYPLAKHRFIGQRTISGVVKLSLLFTSAVTAIPQYIVMSSIGIVNTYWALIFPAFQAALGLYLMQSFMGQIPEEMLEAARIDGANAWQQFWSITLPLITSSVRTLGLLIGIWAFNTFDVIYMMTQGGPANSSSIMVNFIYQNAFQFNNRGYSAAISVVSFLILSVFAVLYVNSKGEDTRYE